MKTILSALALLICFGFFSDGVKDLQFLEGTWKAENKNLYETWKFAGEHNLVGSSYKIVDDKEVVTEELLISTAQGEIFYQAKVYDQNNAQPITFVLNKDIKNKFSFENLSHDFPKKIRYTKVDDKTILVEVLGSQDKGFSYKMFKQ